MRSLTGQLLVPILATLLVLTTPVGTGQGVHENELLHPVLPHAHLIDGRMVSEAQLATARAVAAGDYVTNQATHALALGADNGADAAGLGIALGPTLPTIGLSIALAPEGRLSIFESASPTEYRDDPQDPPPDHFA